MFAYRKNVILIFQFILFIMLLNSCDPGWFYTINGKEIYKIKTECDSLEVQFYYLYAWHHLLLRSKDIKIMDMNLDSLLIIYDDRIYHPIEVIDEDDSKIISFNDDYDYNIFRGNTIKIVKIYMNGFIKCNGKAIFPDTLVAVPKEY